MQHCNDDRLTILSPLLYTIKEKWEEELGEETGKVETCLCCGAEHKTKSTLGKHIKKIEECKNFYLEYNERPKPCGQGNCNFAHKETRMLKRHQREASSGEQKIWDPNKKIKVDKVQAVAEKINKHTKEIANGQIRQVDENTWECVTCGKIEDTKHLKSLMGHLGKHNRKTKVGKKQEKTDEKNKKTVQKRSSQIKQNKHRSLGPEKHEIDYTTIPEEIRMIVYLGHIKKKIENNEVKWECTKCAKSWESAKSTKNHVVRTCWKFTSTREHGKFACPYCNKEYANRGILSYHIIRDGCEIFNTQYLHRTGEEMWKDIVEKNTQ